MDFLLLIKYVFLGLLQGFTEPIPISSSGHLVIAQELLGIKMDGFGFEVIVNFASLLAVLLVYQDDVGRLTKNSLLYIQSRSEKAKPDFKFVLLLVLATIPAAVFGLLYEDVIAEKLKGLHVIGVTLLVTALALWLIRNLKGSKDDYALTWKDAALIGVAQAVALIPGISRSGATIVAAMGLGIKQETALRFSFFLYIPVSVGAGILGMRDFFQEPNLSSLWLPYTLAFLCSFAMSYISLKWFMGLMARGNLKYFTVYCLLVGALLLVLTTA